MPKSLKIIIDRDECIGDGACCDDAPSTFVLDDEGKAVCQASRDDDDVVLTAAKNCPTNAIVLQDERGVQVWPEV